MKRQKRQSNHRSYLALACLLWTALLLTVYALADTFTVKGTFAWADAFTVTATGDSGGTVSVNGESFKLTSKKGTSGTCGDTLYTTTLRLTAKADLESVTFKASTTGGTLTQTPTTLPTSMSEGDSITISIKSTTSAAGAATLKVSGVKVKVKKPSTTFSEPTNGKYTIAYNGVTYPYGTYQLSNEYKYRLVATPTDSSKYEFFAWLNDANEVLSTESTYEYRGDEDHTIRAIFYPKGNAVYYIKGSEGVFYEYLDTVITATGNNSKTIVAYKSGNVVHSDGSTKSFEIPSNVTFLVPYDDAATLKTTAPEIINNSYEAPKEFRTLTLPSNTKITVSGTLSVGGKLNAGAGGGDPKCSPTGPYGRIKMGKGSSLEVSGTLSAFGYITGTGTIKANSTAKIYEIFELREYPGGGGLSDMNGNDKKVFPISQYYIENVEVPLTLESGAQETGIAAININSGTQPASVTLIGKDSGLFQLSDGKITKTYINNEDKCRYDINGNAKITSVKLSLGSYSFDSSKYVLPINSNMIININSDTTTLAADAELLPGVELSIAKNAALISEQSLYVYDNDDWKANFVFSGQKMRASAFHPNRSKTRTANDLKDAVVDVNGRLQINGNFYTTAGKASIISSEKTGVISLNAVPGTQAKIYQRTTQSGSGLLTTVSYGEVSITAAQLKNDDGSYTATAGASANDEFSYCATCDMWKKKPHSHDSASYNVTISWPELAFTYTRSTSTTYTWDGEGKKYKSETSDSGSWTDNSKNIKVLNTSSAGDVNAQFNFTAQTGLHWTEAPSMAFTCGEATVTAPIPVPVTTDDKGTTVTATLSGTPAADFTEKQIGTITVTITAAQGG